MAPYKSWKSLSVAMVCRPTAAAEEYFFLLLFSPQFGLFQFPSRPLAYNSYQLERVKANAYFLRDNHIFSNC